MRVLPVREHDGRTRQTVQPLPRQRAAGGHPSTTRWRNSSTTGYRCATATADRRYDGGSPVRREIFDAGGHLAQGLIQLVELAIGLRVFMTSGPWLDPYEGWHGGLGWDISEQQDTPPEGEPMTADPGTFTILGRRPHEHVERVDGSASLRPPFACS